ncbi:MAG: 50S ribosomal protein L25 [Deltaproteobacteria bacterium]|nr:50S ribosomal protein L25 [Deltaproteobacteria bacterium]
MEASALEISVRSELGSAASRRLRREGSLPAVVYFGGKNSIPILLNNREFVRLAERTHASLPILLRSEDARLNGKYVVVKEIQKDYIKGLVKHVDLHLLDEASEIEMDVLIKPEGLAFGVKNEGGILAVASRTIRVCCLPKDLPEFLEVDVSELRVGHSLHARDVVLPAGVKLSCDPDAAVVAVVSSKKAHMEEAAAPTEAVVDEGAEGAAAAEGEAAGAASEAKDGKSDKEKDA